MARIQAIEGRTIVDDIPPVTAGKVSGRWDILQYKTDNVFLLSSDWADVFTTIQQDTAFRDGDTVFFPAGEYEFAGAGLVITRPLRITGSSPVLSSPIHTRLIELQSSRVAIDGVTFKGLSASTYSGSAYSIYSKAATFAEGYKFISITNCQFYDIAGIAIQLEFAKNVVVRDCYFKTYARAANMFLSCEYVVVENCVIEDATNGAGNPSSNCYPIAFSRNNNIGIAAQPRSKNCIARNNLVVDNPWWEGIDTHGGDTIIIENNILYNVAQPIAIVSSNNESSVDSYAPLNCIVRGNYMNSLRADGGYSAGIVVDGAGSGTAGSFVELSSCIVADNIVIGYGKQAVTTNMGGIVFKYTDGVIIKGNLIDAASPYGIYVGNDNYSYVISDNIIKDVWSTTVTGPTAINAPSFYHEGFVHGNKITRGTKTAAFVNIRGVAVVTGVSGTTPATHNSQMLLGWNDFQSCVEPIRQGTNMEAAGGILKFAVFPRLATSPITNTHKLPIPVDLGAAPTGVQIQASVNGINAVLRQLGYAV